VGDLYAPPCIYVQRSKVEIQSETHADLIGRGITPTPRPVLLPSSILPPPSTQWALIYSRRKSTRVSIM